MASRSLSGNSGGGTYTYNLKTKYGNTVDQSTLNNNMSGNEANAIYYATHGGSGYATPESGNVTVKAPTPKNDTDTDKKTGTTTNTGAGTGSYSYNTSAYGNSGVDIEALLAAQRAAADEAYSNSMARLENAFNQSMENLDYAYNNNLNMLVQNRDATRNRLKSQYDFSEGRAQTDADKSLREAYINYMMNKKNLAQGLSALGLSGGATESNMAKMFNNYGSSRNNINTTLAENLASLLNEYQNNISNAEQLYNTQYSDAQSQYMSQLNNLINNKMSMENALESNWANAKANVTTGSNLSGYASYLSALASAQPYFQDASFYNGNYVSNLANLNNEGKITPTQNTLGVNSVSTTQGNDMGSVTDYAKWKAMADSIASQGGNSDTIIYQLLQNGADRNMIHSVFGV